MNRELPGDEPNAGSSDNLATTFIARQIQRGRSDGSYWHAMAEKVDAFLKQAYPQRSLPAGYEREDLRQDVFVRLVTDLPTMEILDCDRFWGFVKTLADRAAIDVARHGNALKRGGGRRPPQQGSADGRDSLAHALDDRVSTASGHARAAEIEERELECVRKLSREEAQQVYLLRRRDRQSFQQIADALGRHKTVTVRTIYARAQRQVIACLMSRLDGYISGVRSGIEGPNELD